MIMITCNDPSCNMGCLPYIKRATTVFPTKTRTGEFAQSGYTAHLNKLNEDNFAEALAI